VSKIDSKDLEIIKIMNQNSRISMSSIAKKLNLSVNAVKKRIIAMEEERVIQGYTCELIPGVLREETGLARVTISSEIKSIKDVTDTIGSQELVFLVGVGVGNQVVVVFTYRSNSDVLQLEEYIKSQSFVVNVEIFLLLVPPHRNIPEITPVDYKIISILSENGRMSLQKLSERIQISTRTLKKRIDKLIDHNLIYFPLILSPGSSEDLILFTIFCELTPNANKIVFFQKIMKKYPNSWVGWIVVDKPILIFIFFTSHIKDIRNVEDSLKQDPAIVSTETLTGGEGYYYPDWRLSYIRKMAKKYVRK